MAPAIKAGRKARKIRIATIVEPVVDDVNDASSHACLDPYE